LATGVGILLLLMLPPDAPDADRIDVILQQLEDRGASVDDLNCRVEYTVEDTLADDKFTKFGRILYQKQEPNPNFLVYFEKMHQADIVNRKREWYLFDGRFLWEVKEAAKNKIQHEVVEPGEKIDLFDIEASPIPIPFGQKKAQIQKNFLVVLVSPAEGDPPDTDHLVCAPKPDSRLHKDYLRLEFYVSRSLHLPVKMVTVLRGGTQINTAVFPDLSAKSINTGLSDADFELPPETRKWKTVETTPDPSLPAPRP
jgi:hypothetical protein